MDYIVKPKYVYFMGIAENFQVLGVFIGLFCLALSFILLLVNHIGYISFAILGIIFNAIACLIPDKNTIIQMIVAKNLTYTNANKIIAEGKTLKEELKADVMDIILAVKKEQPK